MKAEVEVRASCWPVGKRPRGFLFESEETFCDMVKDLVVLSLFCGFSGSDLSSLVQVVNFDQVDLTLTCAFLCRALRCVAVLWLLLRLWCPAF